MIKQTAAIFYDGTSAKPHTIALQLHVERAELRFDDPQGYPRKWPVQEVSFTRSGNKATVQFGSDNLQSLVLQDARFMDEIAQIRRANPQHWYENMLAKGFKWHLLIALFLLGMIGLGYFFAIPWVGEQAANLIPESYDDQLGKLAFKQSTMLSDTNVRKTKILNDFAAQMDFGNTKDLHFTVIESPVVNAFALPDGNIVVYSGIIDKMQSPHELAGLLGHEAAHVNHRHSMKILCRNLSGYIFISAVLGDANAVMATVADNANTLRSLSFSRQFEHQADEEGFKIVTNNHMDPRGMAQLFGRLEDFGSFVPEFLSSHPMTKERIAYINEMVKTQPHRMEPKPEMEKLFKALKK